MIVRDKDAGVDPRMPGREIMESMMILIPTVQLVKISVTPIQIAELWIVVEGFVVGGRMVNVSIAAHLTFSNLQKNNSDLAILVTKGVSKTFSF